MRIKESIVNPSMISASLLEHEIVENGVKYIQVHPTFLYESCWNLCVLGFMLWYRKKKKFDGEMLWIYFLYVYKRQLIRGYFAGAEMAVASVNKNKIHRLKEQGNTKAALKMCIRDRDQSGSLHRGDHTHMQRSS